ncbi:MAG: peptidoglycan DD-metalloendopeptidase family protein, partial [Pseudomonadales bacterium]
MRFIAVTGLVLLLTIGALAGESSDPKVLQQQLRALSAEIEEFKQLLQNTESERNSLQSTLEDNEKSISDLLNKIEVIEQNLREGEDKVGKLKQEQLELEHAKAVQQDLIAKQIRAAYEIGNQEYLKVVLNQEDPNQLARMLTYYDYFNRARAAQVKGFRDTIAELDRVSMEIVGRNRQLTRDRLALRREKASLELVQVEKEQTLAAIISDLEKTGTKLEIRVRDRERLESLLERITGIADLQSPANTLPFGDRKGKLLLPVAGTVSDRFGSKRTGDLRWNGVFIEASEGEPVVAVHYGHVVFSDWLRGFGLLLIINHGDGY